MKKSWIEKNKSAHPNMKMFIIFSVTEIEKYFYDYYN